MSDKKKMPRLKAYYETSLRGDLKEKLGLSNDLAVPRLTKVVLNMGLGKRVVQDSKALSLAEEDLALISGQKPVITKAKRSIAAFKLREGMGIGVSVTLRKNAMYYFLDRFLTAALPRSRNYQGASVKSFDSQANYALGIPEHTIFYEVDYNKVPYTLGMDIVFVMSSSSRKANYMLLRGLGVPFRGEV